MFNIGWGEVFVIILVGLIVVGPERLPGVIQDVRAAVFAARKAIANAKQELNGEFDGLDEFRKPMSTVTEYAAMGPKKAIAKVLFDEDESYLDALNPATMMDGDPVPAAGEQKPTRPRRKQPGVSQPEPPATSGGGFSWTDVT